jgi:hypothetical protein
MGNKFAKTICLVLGFALIFAGCQRKDKEEVVEVLARGPDLTMISVPPDYVVRAIEAAGGLTAWMNTKELQLDCIVTLYQPDGSFYITEQHHVVYPWSNSIQISAREPQGSFLWQLSNGQFEVLQGLGQIERMPVEIGGSRFAEMILSVSTIPARFYDDLAEFSKETTGIKIQGQWYYPMIRRTRPTLESVQPLSPAIFYQNRDSSLVDMLLFAGMSGEKFFAVRGYDYAEVEKEGVRIPARIEIFKADAGGNLYGSLAKIDYHAFKRAK